MKLEAKLGNPVLIFIYTLAVPSVGCAIGMHYRAAPGLALCFVVGGAAVMVVHDLVSGILLLWGTAEFLRRKRMSFVAG